MHLYLFYRVLSLGVFGGLAATSSTPESPYGLTFTPSTLVASRLNASGSIELARSPLGSDFQTFYQNAVQHFDQPDRDEQVEDRNHIESMFRNAIMPLTEQLRKQLGYSPEYAAFFFPSVFRPTIRHTAIAGMRGGLPNRPVKDGRASQAVGLAYGFLEGKNLGRDLEQCTDEGPLNLILVLEYERDYLHAWLLEVVFEFGFCAAEQDRFCKRCGEVFREIDGEETYRNRVDDFLNSFVEHSLQEHDHESVRAIVVSGESSAARSRELGEMARNAVGSQSARVLTDIDPSEVVAHGAAVWARRVQREPRRFIIDSTSNLNYDVNHDEL